MRYGFLIILLFICTHLAAQQHNDYTFRHLDQTDGLLHNNVLGIQQDAAGFMWILTPNGLQRYDGSRFVNYQGIVNNPVNGITNGAELYADNKENLLWVMKKNIIEKLVLQTNTLANYIDVQLVKDPAYKFDTYRDSANQPCLLGEKGIFFLSADKKKVISSALNIRRLQPHESCMLVTDSLLNLTWSTGTGRLILFKNDTKEIFTEKYNPVNNPLLTIFDNLHITPRFIMIDNRHDYWISTWGNLFYRFTPSTGAFITYNLSAINKLQYNKNAVDLTLLVNALYEDNNHNIWIATENAGLLLYHTAEDFFENIIVDKTNKQGIEYNFKIYCITQDKEQNIWLGTDKGISIFNPYGQYFKVIQHDDNNPSIPKNEILNYIQTSGGNILAGTWGGGIAVYDPYWNFKKNIRVPGPYQYNMVWCFMQQDGGPIWAGCQHGYIHLYDPAAETITTIHPPELDNSTIRCMAKDAHGNIWFGLNNGKIAEWSKAENKFYPYNDSTQKGTNNHAIVYHIFIDKDQHFWVSTERGFKEFDAVKRSYAKVYLPDAANPFAISAITSQCAEALDDTTVVIGTIYGGLNFFTTTTGRFSHITTTDGLPANTIYALKKDSAGFIWFTTEYNLYKFKPGGKKFIRYNIEPGIINSSFNTNNFYALKNGAWLTASTTEIISFEPVSAPQKKQQQKVSIVGFKIFDDAIYIDSLLLRKTPVKLSYRQNFLTVEFALLNFSDLRQTKYFYKLSGVDKDWVSADTKKFASYTNLGPGQYTFSVKMENDMGMSQPTSFVILISPPFWQTWWFRLCYILLGAFSIYWLIKRRINAIKHEAGLKQKIAETEMMALRAQMNPHFIFNCLNSIDNLIQMDEKEKATLYLSKFAKLIRSILENSNKNVVPCWKDMETLQLYLTLEALRWDKKFTYQVSISDEILNGDYKVPPLIIQPFVENAIHHGLLNKIEGDKKLLIAVSVSNNHIQYVIEDNGVGRIKANAYKQLNKPSHQSMGMQITTDRIHLFNQGKNGSVTITDLENDQQRPAGTRVVITLINQP